MPHMMKYNFLQCKKTLILIALAVIGFGCNQQTGILEDHKAFIQDIRQNKEGFYYLDYNKPQDQKAVTVGIFDSGIGGLTVFDAILNADNYGENGENKPDGKRISCMSSLSTWPTRPICLTATIRRSERKNYWLSIY